MEDILKDINAVMGVTGSFVCNGEGQVLASALSDLFDETTLSTVGRPMAQTMAGLAIARRLKGNKKWKMRTTLRKVKDDHRKE